MAYSTRRQRFLVDQGYAFKVITHLEGMKDMPGLHYKDEHSRLGLLQTVLMACSTVKDIMAEDFMVDGKGNKVALNKRATPGMKRSTGRLTGLSGGDDMAYEEFETDRRKKVDTTRHALFRRRDQEALKRKKEREMALMQD